MTWDSNIDENDSFNEVVAEDKVLWSDTAVNAGCDVADHILTFPGNAQSISEYTSLSMAFSEYTSLSLSLAFQDALR